jgi:hypothetical protein
MTQYFQRVRRALYGDHDPYFATPRVPFDDGGWNSEDAIFDEIIHSTDPRLIIEVGTWKGRSARHMAKICKGKSADFEIVCVDTFLGCEVLWPVKLKGHIQPSCASLYDQFRSNTLDRGLESFLTPMQVDSHNASLILGALTPSVAADLIYIDGSHDAVGVSRDLADWCPLLKPGGVLIGDDFTFPSVKSGIDAVLGLENIEDRGRKFVWRRPQNWIPLCHGNRPLSA